VTARLLALAVVLVGCAEESSPTTERAALGRLIFDDPALSRPPGQACADCHAARVAFRDPESDHATSAGAIASRFGARNAPSTMYAPYIPELVLDPIAGEYTGGQFWDGHAAALEDQAALPLLNPIEMNNPDKATVVAAIARAPYARRFAATFGPLDDVDAAFAHVAEALAAYERSPAMSPFDSKYDRYLAGTASLTAEERRGLAIFEDPARGNCASCHPSRPGPDGAPPMFTTYGYANLGVPRYANSAFFTQPRALNPAGPSYIDHGLMGTTGAPRDDGRFRIPTLRDVARTAPYGHNGYFASLPYILDFLNTRDVGSTEVGTCSRATPTATCAWPPPEVPRNLDPRVGHLGLSPDDLEALAAFLATLDDHQAPRAGAGHHPPICSPTITRNCV